MSLEADSGIKKLQSEIMVELYFAPAKDHEMKEAIANICEHLFDIKEDDDCVWVDSMLLKAVLGQIAFSTIIFPIRILKNQQYADKLRNIYESSTISFEVSELVQIVPDVNFYYYGNFFYDEERK